MNSHDDARPAKVNVKYSFELISEKPILSQNDVVSNEVKRMLEASILDPLESLWTSPVVLTAKKDGNRGVAFDYRRYKAVSMRHRLLMPW